VAPVAKAVGWVLCFGFEDDGSEHP
jgi:hypothetical protein